MPNKHQSKDKNQSGAVLILIIVFTGIFLLSISSLLGLVVYQKRLNDQHISKVQAIHIAEAGINYYRWHLAHDVEDYTDGTGEAGPYIHTYEDPTTGLIGTFSLEITPPEVGSTIVTIKSVGWVNKYPNIKKTLEVKYGKPSLAKYSYLTNTDIWLGDSESVSGQLHSNGGVRMDGTNDSLVTSAKETYICTPSHGCSNEEKPGVWGSGPNSDLWSYPVAEIDFNSITMDLANLKTEAESNGHYYDHANYGYHVIFQNDGTYNLYRVTRLRSSLLQIDDDDFSGCEWKAEQIRNEVYEGNFSIPNNGIIFIEDNVWVEGTVNGKVTLASARFPDSPSTNTSIIINDSVQYLARDGNHSLGLIAQKNVQVPRHAPNNLYIDGIMLAQKGRTYRGYYCFWWQRSVKDYIEVYGGIITNKIWTWSWVSGSTTVDGYRNTMSIYDSKLTFEPPPSFPTSSQYEFISWEEIPN